MPRRAFEASKHPMAPPPAPGTSDTISPMAGPSSFRRFQQYFSSSVGTKLLIGITGLLLFVYMILHLAGNALIFAGAAVFNEYSHRLIANPLIIPIELGLLAVFVIHIYKTIRMVIANSAARPIGYQKKAYAGHTSRKSVASSTMIASGLFLLAFVLIHVKQFKFGAWYQTVSANPIRDLARTESSHCRRPTLLRSRWRKRPARDRLAETVPRSGRRGVAPARADSKSFHPGSSAAGRLPRASSRLDHRSETAGAAGRFA